MDTDLTIHQILGRAIQDNLTLEIVYAKNDYERSSRVISNISTSKEYGIDYISAYCHTRKKERTFKISRISSAKIVPNPNKPIFNLYEEIY